MSQFQRMRRMATALAVLASALAAIPASAAGNAHQRGPDPTQASIAANRGTFATAETSVGGGDGFGAAKIYYPTDTSQGTFGAIAVVPGYTATWAAEGAWLGHWLASFGFVVIGIDTINRNDREVARGTQLLAALDYLTQRSSALLPGDPGTTFSLAGSASGKCADVPGRVQTNGTGLILRTCNSAVNQQWTQKKWTVDADGTVTNAASGRCLDTGGTADNSPVVVNTCNGASGQNWAKRS